mmetsp:Transcript_12308/g.19865  ORF Transcript_12308/g.19865 Transcript_12308/m.19865 type:complete len:1163 (+) Transcript_12308:57-3545(+)
MVMPLLTQPSRSMYVTRAPSSAVGKGKRHAETTPRKPVASQQGNFYFQRRHGRLDWRSLSAVDIDRIIREVDIEALQNNLENIAYADIESEDLRQFSDTNYVKIFRLSQLIIEYLLYVQEWLSSANASAEMERGELAASLEELAIQNEKKAEEIGLLQKELRQKKRAIATYEYMLTNPNAPAAAVNGAANVVRELGESGVINKCAICEKIFTNAQYLDAHYQRRHPGQTPPVQIKPSPVPSFPTMGLSIPAVPSIPLISPVGESASVRGSMATGVELRDIVLQETQRVRTVLEKQLRDEMESRLTQELDVIKRKEDYMFEVKMLEVKKELFQQQQQQQAVAQAQQMQALQTPPPPATPAPSISISQTRSPMRSPQRTAVPAPRTITVKSHDNSGGHASSHLGDLEDDEDTPAATTGFVDQSLHSRRTSQRMVLLRTSSDRDIAATIPPQAPDGGSGRQSRESSGRFSRDQEREVSGRNSRGERERERKEAEERRLKEREAERQREAQRDKLQFEELDRERKRKELERQELLEKERQRMEEDDARFRADLERIREEARARQQRLEEAEKQLQISSEEKERRAREREAEKERMERDWAEDDRREKERRQRKEAELQERVERERVEEQRLATAAVIARMSAMRANSPILPLDVYASVPTSTLPPPPAPAHAHVVTPRRRKKEQPSQKAPPAPLALPPTPAAATPRRDRPTPSSTPFQSRRYSNTDSPKPPGSQSAGRSVSAPQLRPQVSARLDRRRYKYLPSKDARPYARTMYPHNQEDYNRERNEVVRDLEDRLSEYNVRSDEKGLDESAFTAAMQGLQSETADDADMHEMREEIRVLVDDIVGHYYRPETEKFVPPKVLPPVPLPVSTPQRTSTGSGPRTPIPSPKRPTTTTSLPLPSSSNRSSAATTPVRQPPAGMRSSAATPASKAPPGRATTSAPPPTRPPAPAPRHEEDDEEEYEDGDEEEMENMIDEEDETDVDEEDVEPPRQQPAATQQQQRKVDGGAPVRSSNPPPPPQQQQQQQQTKPPQAQVPKQMQSAPAALAQNHTKGAGVRASIGKEDLTDDDDEEDSEEDVRQYVAPVKKVVPALKVTQPQPSADSSPGSLRAPTDRDADDVQPMSPPVRPQDEGRYGRMMEQSKIQPGNNGPRRNMAEESDDDIEVFEA